MKFNDSWCSKFKFIQKSRKGEGFALCTVCGNDFSIAHGGGNDIKNTRTPQGIRDIYVDSAQRQRKLNGFGASSTTRPKNLNQKVVKAELLLSGFLVERNLSLSTANHAAKVFSQEHVSRL